MSLNSIKIRIKTAVLVRKDLTGKKDKMPVISKILAELNKSRKY